MILTEFLSGNSFDAHRFFGMHFEEGCAVFRVYAPHAAKVTLEGDFTGWQEWEASYSHHGIWTFHIYHAQIGQCYKYCVYSKRGKRQEHADPYGNGMGDYGCSVIRNLDSYEFRDWDWMCNRSLNFDRPMSIYELHLGSWGREHGHFQSYDRIADSLVPYLLEHHYTHVEFMPLNEHPLDGSWGYQATGFFSPTARFGEPWQLMNLIDRLHRVGIGAILDFICVHFAVDHYGLKLFDGSALYESKKIANRKSDWGSYFFEHSQGEVRSFLKSAADYWLRRYHFDGLRFDAVSRLIYGHGEPQFGENPGGLAFLREINTGLEQLHPTAMRIAEDSTLYPNVTKSVQDGGLGFHYKWAMGWSYDTVGFFFLAPEQRLAEHWRLTNTLSYFQNERFLLPISHDTVGTRTLISRIAGTDKLHQAKLLHLVTAVHPGKKLLFHGSELGSLSLWNPHRELDKTLLKDPKYHGFAAFCDALNQLYCTCPALFEADYAPWSARWVCAENGIFALVRHSREQHMLLIINASDSEKEQWFPLEGISDAQPVLHTHWSGFGGKLSKKDVCIKTTPGWVGVRLPKFGGLLAEILF